MRFRFRSGAVAAATRKTASLDRNVGLAQTPHAVFRELGGAGGGVLVHLRTTAYFRVNELGARIWDLMGDSPTFGELLVRLQAQLENPPVDLEVDVTVFIEELIRRDLVVLRPGS